MLQVKASLFVMLLLLGAFFWGYFEDSINLNMLSSSGTDNTSNSAPNNVSQDVSNSTPPANANLKPNIPNPANNKPTNIKGLEQKSAPSNSLADTLNSVRPGEISQPQQAERSAYFDQLTKQLEDLKAKAGDTIPSEQNNQEIGTIADPQNVYPNLGQSDGLGTDPELPLGGHHLGLNQQITPNLDQLSEQERIELDRQLDEAIIDSEGAVNLDSTDEEG